MSCEVAGEGMAEHMEATENRPFAVLRSRFERFPAGAVVNRLSSIGCRQSAVVHFCRREIVHRGGLLSIRPE